MKGSWSYVVTNNDTAQSVLNRFVKQRLHDRRSKNAVLAYTAQEFSNAINPETGHPLPNGKYSISHVTLDKVIEHLEASDHSSFNTVCSHLKTKLGLPFVVRPEIAKDCQRRMRSPEEIALKLDKLRRQCIRERKQLQAVTGEVTQEPPISSRLAGALQAVDWIYNSGKTRSWDTVFQRLYELKVAQERDRLFHVRRHEKDRGMNNCFDEETNGAIAEFNWVLVDNPFCPISMPGLSKFPIPVKNPTFIDHDE